MRTCIIIAAAALTAALVPVAANAGNKRSTKQVESRDLGIVEAPAAGSTALDLSEVPAVIKHTAMVAFKSFDGEASLTGAQVDADEVRAIYEVSGVTSKGELLEADIAPDATLLELEIEIPERKVPRRVFKALERFAPTFKSERPALIEKSVRPSEGGLSEVWYEFSGVNFDVEVRSDARALLIEPA